MTYTNYDTGQNIGGVLAAMKASKGVPRGFTGTPGFRQRRIAATQAASRKVFGPMPLSEADLKLARMIEKMRQVVTESMQLPEEMFTEEEPPSGRNVLRQIEKGKKA